MNNAKVDFYSEVVFFKKCFGAALALTLLLLTFCAIVKGLATQVLWSHSMFGKAVFVQENGRDTVTELFAYANRTAISLGYVGSADAGLHQTQAFWSKDGSVLAVTTDDNNLTDYEMSHMEADEQNRRLPPLAMIYDFRKKTVFHGKQANWILACRGGRGEIVFKGQSGFSNNARPQMLWE